ncbi:MAG: carboxypeptidase-like regulatory domain-containing protein [Bacteroidota bacterium]
MKKYLLILALSSSWLLYGQQAAVLNLPLLDKTRLLAQDEAVGAQRISAAQNLPDNASEYGIWASYLNTGGKTEFAWSITFQVEGAPGLGLFLNEVDLPDGSYLEWSADGQDGQKFTQSDVSSERRLFLGFVSGETGQLRYYAAGEPTDQPPFRLWRIDQVFRPEVFKASGMAKDFDDSNECQIDANCPAGDGWDEEKSSNARLMVIVAEGVGICSGNLMNNTAENGRPLLLTGFHCFDGFTPLYDMWTFDFGFRYPTCGSTDPNPPPFVRYTGSEYLAGRRENDFLLLEISDTDFDSDFHFFAGWDRSDGNVAGDLIIFHHPAADVQKLSTGNEGMTVFGGSINWDNGVVTPPNHHYRMNLNTGNAEPGSSGSAVFDDNRRVRGHINGGVISCPDTDPFLWIGRLHLAWTGGGTPDSRLSDWLDPLQLDTLHWDGSNLAGNTGGRILRGQVRNNGFGVGGVDIYCAWSTGETDTVTTDADGFYTLPRPAATSVSISGFYETENADDGVDVVDAVAVRRHILGLATLSPLAELAADATNDGFAATTDVFRLTQAILGVNEWIERPSWMVFPELVPLDPLPTDVWQPTTININNPQAVIAELNLLLVKNGDANLSTGQ